jgi:hypothetical protein
MHNHIVSVSQGRVFSTQNQDAGIQSSLRMERWEWGLRVTKVFLGVFSIVWKKRGRNRVLLHPLPPALPHKHLDRQQRRKQPPPLERRSRLNHNRNAFSRAKIHGQLHHVMSLFRRPIPASCVLVQTQMHVRGL